MAINGPVTPASLKRNAGAIARKYGWFTYLKCWFNVALLHRQTLQVECIFACLEPRREEASPLILPHAPEPART